MLGYEDFILEFWLIRHDYFTKCELYFFENACLHSRSKNRVKNRLHASCFQIAEGMCFVASQGIVHRDLRAGNLLLASPKLVKISNFELALDLQDRKKPQVKTSKKSLLNR